MGRRYHPDREIRRRVEEEISRAREVAGRNEWITYVMRDPTERDLNGSPDGAIFYVGQTRDFPSRVVRRFSYADEYARRPRKLTDKRVVLIWRKGSCPRFEVIDRAETHLLSLVSETNAANRLLAAGYKLTNQWKEHRGSTMAVTRHDVPPDRIWPFTIADAIADEITVELVCTDCSIASGPLDLMALVGSMDPVPKTLNDVKRLACDCGRTGGHYVKLRVP